MNKLLSKAFIFMFIGLLTTFLTGYIVSINENMVEAIFMSNLYWIFALVDIALVLFFSIRIYKMKSSTAKLCFLLYSFINGLTFSSIFLAFDIWCIMYVFLVTAIVFGIFGALGYYTKLDLTKLGTFCFMALIAVFLCMIINIFLNNSTFDLIITIATLIIFIGYAAYDVKHLKMLNEINGENETLAIYGAFELYLDYINIFINLLQLLGDQKD